MYTDSSDTDMLLNNSGNENDVIKDFSLFKHRKEGSASKVKCVQ